MAYTGKDPEPTVPQASSQPPAQTPGYGAPAAGQQPGYGGAPASGGQPGAGTGTATFGPEDFPMTEAAPAPTDQVEEVPEEEEEKEPNLAAFLEAVINLQGSDLHLTSGLPPMIRVFGDLRPLKGYRKLFPQDLQTMIYSILTQRQRERFENDLELDVS